MAPANVSLKLLVDTKGHWVLFAEAGKDFVDFLFFMLSLPVATVITLLTKQGMVGCLGNLYKSTENLGDTYFQATTNKDALLKPKVSSYGANVPLLLPNIQSSTGQIYRCLSHENPATLAKTTSKVLNSTAANQGGYVKGAITYTIMDDLTVTPMSTILNITMLNKFKVKEVGALQERVIYLGMNEGVKLLKASLQSKTVLTVVFLTQKVGRKRSK
ncbi:hypothetical protein DITRI_Ditri02bG0147700 [Diplodiscus trichospermus]